MLNLSLYFLLVVGASKIYTEFVPWSFVRKLPFICLNLYIDLCLLLKSLSDSVIFIYYDSCQFYTIIGDASPIYNTL